jgi:hypothetical protein
MYSVFALPPRGRPGRIDHKVSTRDSFFGTYLFDSTQFTIGDAENLTLDSSKTHCARVAAYWVEAIVGTQHVVFELLDVAARIGAALRDHCDGHRQAAHCHERKRDFPIHHCFSLF